MLVSKKFMRLFHFKLAQRFGMSYKMSFDSKIADFRIVGIFPKDAASLPNQIKRVASNFGKTT
jgi:hypothetical protein